MEMVDSVVAGVAFSATPLNPDRDELVIDSSWGLGESVVDGSVTADRYVVDKIKNGRIIEEILGGKARRTALEHSGASAASQSRKTIRGIRNRHSTASKSKNLIETTYGMPMDVEVDALELKLGGSRNDNTTGRETPLVLRLQCRHRGNNDDSFYYHGFGLYEHLLNSDVLR
jgi:hypothetical protein